MPKLKYCQRVERIVKRIREQETYTPQDISKINSLANRCKVVFEIGSTAQFFLKLLCPDQYADFMLRKSYAQDRLKYIQKLAAVGSSRINVSDEVGQPIPTSLESDLVSLLIGEHIFERMKKYGHSFDPTQEPQFKTILVDPFCQVIADCRLYTVTDQVKFLEEQKGRGIQLRLKGEFTKGRFKEVSLDNLKNEDILRLLKEYALDAIEIIFPPEMMTIPQLIDNQIIYRDENGDLHPIEGYQYLENGFEFYPRDRWAFLKPIDHHKTDQKDFKIEVLVHKPKHGGIEAQGHASLKISTPSGEVYSVGFFPKASNTTSSDSCMDKYDARVKPGVLLSPDHYIFMPAAAYDTEVISFNFDDAKIFHAILGHIEKLNGDHPTENDESDLFFQRTHHNCAVFAKEVADLAIKLGAVKTTPSPSFNWERMKNIMTNIMLTAVANLPFLSSNLASGEEFSDPSLQGISLYDLVGRTAVLPTNLAYAFD